MGFLKDAREQAKAQAAAKEEARSALAEARAPSGMQYRVDTIREKLIGDHVGADRLEELLNQRANEGWVLRHILEADVKGRVGPGGVSGLLVVFERPGPSS
jgi:hypothetical protein